MAGGGLRAGPCSLVWKSLLQSTLGEKLDPGGIPVVWGGESAVAGQTFTVTRIWPGFPGHRHIGRDSQDSKGPWLINSHDGSKQQ